MHKKSSVCAITLVPRDACQKTDGRSWLALKPVFSIPTSKANEELRDTPESCTSPSSTVPQVPNRLLWGSGQARRESRATTFKSTSAAAYNNTFAINMFGVPAKRESWPFGFSCLPLPMLTDLALTSHPSKPFSAAYLRTHTRKRQTSGTSRVRYTHSSPPTLWVEAFLGWLSGALHVHDSPLDILTPGSAHALCTVHPPSPILLHHPFLRPLLDT